MGGKMPMLIPREGESSFTHRALEWFHCSVTSHVRFQSSSSCKGFTALSTRIRLVTCVDANMSFEVTTLSKCS